MAQKWPKIAKMAQKLPKMAQKLAPAKKNSRDISPVSPTFCISGRCSTFQKCLKRFWNETKCKILLSSVNQCRTQDYTRMLFITPHLHPPETSQQFKGWNNNGCSQLTLLDPSAVNLIRLGSFQWKLGNFQILAAGGSGFYVENKSWCTVGWYVLRRTT